MCCVYYKPISYYLLSTPFGGGDERTKEAWVTLVGLEDHGRTRLNRALFQHRTLTNRGLYKLSTPYREYSQYVR